MNETATNYNSYATEDDGSCEYVSIWFTSDGFAASRCGADANGYSFFSYWIMRLILWEWNGAGRKYFIFLIDSLLAAMLMWMDLLPFLFESCGKSCANGMEQHVSISFAWFSCLLLRCWCGWIFFLFFLNHAVNIAGMELSRRLVFDLPDWLASCSDADVVGLFFFVVLNHAVNLAGGMEWSRR